jgi:hypothetical protein
MAVHCMTPPLQVVRNVWHSVSALQVWLGMQLSVYWQLPFTQAAVLLAMAGHWFAAQHSLQVPSPHRWRVPLHFRSHLVPSQAAVALADVGQAVQDEVPHELTLLLSLHSSPQRWNPVRQANAHLAPSHDAWLFAGGWQGEQDVPQFAVSLSETQLPPQSCVPVGQAPSQALPSSMQAPLHSFIFAGQTAPHIVPSQVADPPVGMGQGEHPVPHVSGSLLLAQLLPPQA